MKKLCPNCGTQLDNDAVFCTSCGTNINNGPKLPHFITSLNKRMNITAILIGFAVLGVFIFIFSMLFSFLVANGFINFSVFRLNNHN
ncbi:MAG: zinc-ribbon domain-containing protein [archaeon]|nr:zinc-ribbon domain-containing protein [archaeon]